LILHHPKHRVFFVYFSEFIPASLDHPTFSQ